MNAESWMPVPGYVGAYEVSDLGGVRSVDRTITQMSRWGHPIVRSFRGVALTPWTDDDGYRHVQLRDKRHGIHQLVAAAFIGPRPANLQVRHRNGDAGDNRLCNLVYGTGSENCLDMVEHGTHHETRRDRCPRRHELMEPNLIPAQRTVGKRSCLACNRAHSEARRRRAQGRSVDFQTLADAHYARLIGQADRS